MWGTLDILGFNYIGVRRGVTNSKIHHKNIEKKRNNEWKIDRIKVNHVISDVYHFWFPFNTKNGVFCLYFSSSTQIRIHLYEELRMKTASLFLKTKTGGFKVKYAKKGGT